MKLAGLTLDTGALIALERRRKRAWDFIRVAEAAGRPVRVPTAVMAEFGSPHGKSRALRILLERGVQWVGLSRSLAEQAGEAYLAVKRGPSAVDAMVVALAAVMGDTVLTADVKDLTALTDHFPSVRVLQV